MARSCGEVTYLDLDFNLCAAERKMVGWTYWMRCEEDDWLG